MPSLFQIPSDLPWWVVLAIVVPGAIYGLLFLAMPFGVFGLKSRLELIESQLEDVRRELRALAVACSNQESSNHSVPAAELRLKSAPDETKTAPAEQVHFLRARAEPRLEWRR